MTWADISRELLPLNPVCMVKNALGTPSPKCEYKSSQGHHGIFGKNEKFKSWVDHWINWCPSCGTCNTYRVGDNFASRALWLLHQMELHPEETIAWMDDAPEKIKLDRDWQVMREACNHVPIS